VADDDLELRIAWEQHLGRSSASTTWFESVVSRYRQPARRYHGTRHVRWVVRHVTDLAAAADDLGAVIAAAFFHDVVYDPTRGDNEMASAELADRALTELGWESERRRHVSELVLATIDHDVDSDGCGSDTQVLLAADLAVLAAEPAKYSDYVRGVRGEYAHIDDEAWRTGRSAVLRALLGRRHLFAQALDLNEWEQRARANISAELAMLDR
jgi:predicted metal-dependent HD superfamily phosphohydrolase